MTRVHSRSVRAAVFAMCDRRCVYCGDELDRTDRAQDFAIDHVVPISRGGSNAITNLVASCKACNGAKSDRSLLEFLAGSLELAPDSTPLGLFDTDRIYTAEHVAELIHVRPQTVKRWLRSGELGGYLKSNRDGWRITGADLIAFWESRPGGNVNDGR